MKIKALTTFLDGRDRYEIGDERTVADARGAYFVANGWAMDLTTGEQKDSAVGAVTLDVQDSVIGLGDSNG